MFINDIPTAIKSSMILLFADDAKCYKSISTLADCAALQNESTEVQNPRRDLFYARSIGVVT